MLGFDAGRLRLEVWVVDKSGWSKFHVLHRKSFTTFSGTLSAKNLYKIPKVWRLGRRNFNIVGYIGFLSTIPWN